MRATRILAVAAVLVGVATASGAMTRPNYEGKLLSMHVKFGKSGKPVSIRQVEWDGYPCGGDHFTGGSSESIKIRPDRTFKSTQRVGGIDMPLNFTIKGTFSKDGKSASGTIRVETCVGRRSWSVTKAG
jgi:hypothetical protein